MIDDRERFERAFSLFEPSQPSWDRLLDRRDRKRRNQRIGAVVLAVAIAAAAFGLVSRAFLGGRTLPAYLPNTPQAWAWHDLAPGQLTADGNGVSAIVPGGPGLVAVGSSDGRRHRDGSFLDGPATVWTSTDGASWSRIADSDLGLGRIRDVAVGGPGLVAVGSYGGTTDRAHNAQPGFDDSRNPVIWTSSDGVSWSRRSDLPGPRDAAIEAVASRGSVLVAVGYGSPGPVAWRSTDGSTWRPAPVDGSGQMTDVTASGGGFVAVGNGNEDGDFSGAEIWTSADGRKWTPIPDRTALLGLTLTGVSDGPGGLVAVGFDGDDAAMVTSSDGLRWDRVDPSEPSLQAPREANTAIATKPYAVTSNGHGYVAVGSTLVCPEDRISCSEEDATVWTSLDGRAWSRVPGALVFHGGSMDGVTAWGARFVAVGVGPSSHPVGDLSGTAWISR